MQESDHEAAYFPAGQEFEHLLAPVREVVPAGHVRHDDAAFEGEYVPTAHDVQDTWPDEETLPAGHDKQGVKPSVPL